MDILGLTEDQWIQIGVSLGIILGTWILVGWMLRFLLNLSIRRFTGRSATTINQYVLDDARAPLNMLAVAIALQIAIFRLDFLISITGEQRLSDIFFVLYSLLALVLLWRIINGFLIWYVQEIAPKTETDLDEQLLPFVRRVLMAVLFIVVLIVVLSHFDIEVGGLVATLGIGSLAVALAAQESLSDTISGFMIVFDRPYRIGDRIEIRDLDTWGDVVDIGLRSTRVRTRDNRMVIIPNSLMGKSLIVNHSYPDNEYRIQIEIGLAYGTDIEQAKEVLVNAIRGVEGVLEERGVDALFLQFGDSALHFRLRWWIESYTDTRQMFDRVNSAVYRALEESNISMPFPQRDLHHFFQQEQAEAISKALGKP